MPVGCLSLLAALVLMAILPWLFLDVMSTALLMRTGVMAALAGAIFLNVVVCYRLARPVRGVGILMPGLIPPLIAGTLGPLIGADLLHLRQVERMDTGIVSIGGAGTFDGILLSGIVALYLS
jgi:uncharacterized membrane protein